MVPGAETSSPLDRAAIAKLQAIGRWAAAFAAILAALALASYPLALPFVRSLGNPVEVQPNTAVGILLVALALLVRGAGRWGRATSLVLGAVAAALGAATLVERATGVELHIDGVLSRALPLAPGTVVPWRMGPPAAASLFVAGTALLLLASRAVFAAQALALAAAPMALTGIVGHAYGVAVLYDAPALSAQALPTALAFLAVNLALLCARPGEGFVAGLAGSGAGSAVARRVLVYAVLVPVALGGAVLAVSGAGPRGAFAVSLLVVALALVFSVLVLRDARAIDRMEVAKLRAQAEREASREELARALHREQAARAQAEMASRAKDQFLATLSHELRTPLNAILGWTSLLRGGAGDPERLARGVAVIDRNGRSLAQLVEDLLDMSQIAAGRMEVAHGDVDLLAIVEGAIGAISSAAASKGVAISRDVPSDPPHVVGDASRLGQVVWNLLSNAVKFTPAGGGVEVRLARDGAQAVLEVADTGVGMAPELLGSAFDPFFQADGSSVRRHGGLGLGLAISRTIVGLHGGALEAESDGLGTGSTFRVRLPVISTAALAPEPRRADLRDARVLVVDDDADSRELLLELLRSWGADASGASSVREAVDAIASERPDVVVSDIAMPDEDGFAFLRALRTQEAERGEAPLPVAALTAFARPEDRQRALAAGFDAHLAKPVDAEKLCATIAALLRTARRGVAPGPPSAPGAVAAGDGYSRAPT
jgi:signal transduction histidine kinase/ActR/RegA family two-component response regulator